MTVLPDTTTAYRIVMEDDGERECVSAVDHNDVAIAGTWPQYGHAGWTVYVSELVKQRTGVRINGQARFTSRGAAVNWVEAIAALYTLAGTA